MNSESEPEARTHALAEPSELLRRWKQRNSESEPEARAPEGPSILDLLRVAATTPVNSGQARRTDRAPRTTKSRRKEKRRRQANSLSLRRGR